ncbi:GIN domain-containing protein [Robiginitomaculum antarcticum]|uniref:GIN domain-containing protein n=1 Tax=Robiginitomaculum antarcticum TaxID=437507 RepID=UPI00036FCFC8|nr:DUF2807 domain-containing protein [Robiginitomaculum antarcticum]
MTKFLITAATLPLLASAFAMSAQAEDGPELVIENFVGTVTLITDNTAPLSVASVTNKKDMTQHNDGENLVIDGGIRKPDGDKCKGYYGNWSWSKKKSGTIGGYEDIEDYPKLTISAPSNTILVVRNSIPFIETGDLGGANVEVQACGKINMGDLDGDLRVELSGSGDIMAGNVHDADLNLRGSGDVSIKNARDLRADLSGSGDIVTGNVANADISLRGSGDIELEDVTGKLNLSLRGSGDVSVGNVSGGAEASMRGSGDIEIDSISGPTRLESSGSGDIEVDDGDTDMLYISSSGSSTIEYGGTAKDADLRATGAADIYVHHVTGSVDQRESGSADIDIDKRD